METITAAELKARLDAGDDIQLIDVRQPDEHALASIEGAKLIPLNELHLRVNELDTANTIIVHCHHGPRSQQAVQILEKFGFKKLKHIPGGIDAWATDVDPEMARY